MHTADAEYVLEDPVDVNPFALEIEGDPASFLLPLGLAEGVPGAEDRENCRTYE